MKLDINDNTVWATVWIGAATVVVSIVWAVYLSGVHNDKAIAALVDKGHDPIEARCAIVGSTTQCNLHEIDKIEKLLDYVREDVAGTD